MQIISRCVNEGIVIDGQLRVTVVDVDGDEVTFDVTGPDGLSERITLVCATDENDAQFEDEPSLVCC